MSWACTNAADREANAGDEGTAVLRIGTAFWSARCAAHEGASCAKWDCMRAMCARTAGAESDWDREVDMCVRWSDEAVA